MVKSKHINNRKRRSIKARSKIKQLEVDRLSVHRTPRHIYAQVITVSADGQDRVLASASTTEKSLSMNNGGNIAAAEIIGKAVAERAQKAGVEKVAFDRSGFAYHGRVKALADAARAAGLKF